MRVKSFRVKNYKSIKDSGICYTQPDITILAGKNESGKTALLQALRDFGREVETVSFDTTRNKDAEESEQIEIEVVFELNAEEIGKLIKTLEANITLDLLSQERKIDFILQQGLTVRKVFDVNGQGSYLFGEELTALLDSYELAEIPSKVSDLAAYLEELARTLCKS